MLFKRSGRCRCRKGHPHGRTQTDRQSHVHHICQLTGAGDVLYLATNHYGVHTKLQQIEQLDLPGITIHRARGVERVLFPNGNTLHFITRSRIHAARGMTVWEIVLDDHTNLDDPVVRETLRPCFQQSRGISVERYTVLP